MDHQARAVALTIAGSDSGGGAGVQADLKTFHAFGVFGTTAITALTAQNTQGVEAVHPVDPEFVATQIHVVHRDLAPSACKTGMLANAAVIEAVVDALERCRIRSVVVDPVMVASSGDRLLDPDAEAGLLDRLVPLSTIVTPNAPEAAALTGIDVRDESSMRLAARSLVDAGAGAALIKGGHLEKTFVQDLFWDGSNERIWHDRRIETTSTHGSGCTLSAAIAAALALGYELIDAVGGAIGYTRAAISGAPALGQGNGPLNHWVTPKLG